MIRRRAVLVLLVLVSNAAIIAGAVAFEWKALTIVALFVADGLLGLIRISLERAFARRPAPDDYPPLSIMRLYDLWIEHIMNKRGTMQLNTRLPQVTARNLLYALPIWNGIVVVSVILGSIWYLASPVASIELTLITILPLIVAKHSWIISDWSNNGSYERSSPKTVRPRSVLYSLVLFSGIVFSVAGQPPDLVVAATVLVIGPKLLFDFREAGIGPWPLTFDPTSDTEAEQISPPTGVTRHVFQTDNRALFSWASLGLGLVSVVTFGLFVFFLAAMLIWPLMDVLTESLSLGGTADLTSTIVLALVPAVGIPLGVNWLILWLGHANVEYRLYDDELVAYDRYLEEPQWVVPFDNIESISTTEKSIVEARLIPSAPSVFTTVELECTTDEDRRVEFLAQPDDFVRLVRGRMRERSASM